MIFFIILIISFFSINSQEIARDEINDIPTANFQNRDRQRANQILIDKNVEDGRFLAEQIKNFNEAETDEIVLKTVSPIEGKLGADVFSFKSTFYYGHINVIRRILNSYIQTRFEYTEEEAELLTNFVLYYNAVYRQNYDYILEKYVSNIASIVDKDKIGITLKFSGWSNRSQIIIPIKENILKKENTDIPTEEIEKVQSLPTEKEEEEIEKFKEEKLEKEEKLADKALEKTDNEIKELKKIEKELVDELEESEEKELINEKIEENKKKIEEKEEVIEKIIEKQKEIKKEKENLELEENLNEEEEEVDIEAKKEEEIKEDKNDNIEVKEELKEVKKELEEVKKELEDKENFDKNVVKNKIIYLNTIKYLDRGHYNNELQIIDTDKDDTILISDFKNICSKSFEIFQENILVISFEKKHSKEHKLTLIDKDSLKQIKSSDVDIFWRSPIIIKKDKIFIFEMKDKKVYFTQLDQDLQKVYRTSEEINPNSNITFFDKKIYLNGKNKKNQVDILVLNREDLKIIKRIIQ